MPRQPILVIGETGVGKSALINLVAGENVAGVSNNVGRGTFATTKYPWGNFDLFDTIGYNDVAESNPTEALVNLAHMINDVNSGGISLIVYVMKKGRINAVSKKNYDYFVKTVCESHVPVLLVVTHCEEESNVDAWYASQQPIFVEYGMTFADYVCGSAVDLTNPNFDPDLVPIYARKRARTQEALRRKIREVALEEPWKPLNWQEWAQQIFNEAVTFLRITREAVEFAAPFLAALLPYPVAAFIRAFR